MGICGQRCTMTRRARSSGTTGGYQHVQLSLCRASVSTDMSVQPSLSRQQLDSGHVEKPHVWALKWQFQMQMQTCWLWRHTSVTVLAGLRMPMHFV